MQLPVEFLWIAIHYLPVPVIPVPIQVPVGHGQYFSNSHSSIKRDPVFFFLPLRLKLAGQPFLPSCMNVSSRVSKSLRWYSDMLFLGGGIFTWMSCRGSEFLTGSTLIFPPCPLSALAITLAVLYFIFRSPSDGLAHSGCYYAIRLRRVWGLSWHYRTVHPR